MKFSSLRVESDVATSNGVGRSGVAHRRRPFAQWLNAWRKRSPLSPHWLDWKHLRSSVEELVPHARGWMLDVGCAERPYGDLFAGRVERYVGVDYLPALLEKLPSLWRILPHARNAIDVLGDGYRLPFADASFDTVLSTEVIEHVTEPRRMLREMARVLRPEGALLLTVPFVQPLHGLPTDYWRFTSGALDDLVRSAGLVPERIEPRGDTAATLGSFTAQLLLRSFASREIQSDGSVVPATARNFLFSPAYAAVQLAAHTASRLFPDESLPLGWLAVARKPRTNRS